MNSPLQRLQTKKGVLFVNTVMLYLLTFSEYLLSFIIVPVETHILGDEGYGVLGTAAAIAVYFQIVIDFGFMVSATEDVSKNRTDCKTLGTILSSVTIIKLALSLLSAGLLFLLCRLVPAWRTHTGFFMLYLLSTVISRLLPDFMYRGLEKMTAITVRAVLVKAFFAGMIFLFLHKPEDVYIVPLMNIIGNSVSLIFIYLHLNKKLHIRFEKASVKEILAMLKKSLYFFFSRAASSIYTTSNTVILSIVAGDSITGIYKASDNLSTMAKNAMSPISDSLYPYMLKNKDFKLVRKMLLIFMPIITAGCVLVYFIAPPVCLWFFGEGFEETGYVLRCLIPGIFVILPSYILGFPTLSPMGKAKHVNLSTLLGSGIYLLGLAVLFLLHSVTIYSLALLLSFTEIIIMLYRLIVVLKNKKEFLAQPSAEEPI